jgi:hypothetical protein
MPLKDDQLLKETRRVLSIVSRAQQLVENVGVSELPADLRRSVRRTQQSLKTLKDRLQEEINARSLIDGG